VTYDETFYVEEGRVAAASAAPVADWYMTNYPDTRTVIDVGCGTGEWAWAFAQRGCHVMGVDAHTPPALHVVGVLPVDLTDGYPCDGYDLAICLEVAEHLPVEAAYWLVSGLAEAQRVLFSAATPGQPGIGHVNCQPHDYWHELFTAWGMTYTHIGPSFGEPVADFYRRNMFIYEHS
jgi:SAM-dependent methyltransferase